MWEFTPMSFCALQNDSFAKCNTPVYTAPTVCFPSLNYPTKKEISGSATGNGGWPSALPEHRVGLITRKDAALQRVNWVTALPSLSSRTFVV